MKNFPLRSLFLTSFLVIGLSIIIIFFSSFFLIETPVGFMLLSLSLIRIVLFLWLVVCIGAIIRKNSFTNVKQYGRLNWIATLIILIISLTECHSFYLRAKNEPDFVDYSLFQMYEMVFSSALLQNAVLFWIIFFFLGGRIKKSPAG